MRRRAEAPLKDLSVRHQALYFSETQCRMRPLRGQIADLRIRGKFTKPAGTRPFLGCADERSTDSLPPHIGVNIPTFKIRNGAGLAVLGYRANPDLRETC